MLPKFLGILSIYLSLQLLSTDAEIHRYQLTSILKLTNCAQMVYPERYLTEIGILSGSLYQFGNVCTWSGVSCEKSVHVIAMTFPQTRNEIPWILSWLPSTVRDVQALNTMMRSRIITRTLPKRLANLHLSHCLLHGNLNLQTLPRDLEKLQLYMNHLKGRILLSDLPKKLQHIDLRMNELEKIYVGPNGVNLWLVVDLESQKEKTLVPVVYLGDGKRVLERQLSFVYKG